VGVVAAGVVAPEVAPYYDKHNIYIHVKSNTKL
jgi:hypothetical protein